jgi:hypothetical protein
VETDTSRTTRALLLGGIVVGPFYQVLGLIQAFVREGFDLARHPLSVLANGPGGWAQTANFVLSLMVIAAALGFWRAPAAPRLRVSAVFLALYGLCLLGAAVFPADPVDGFPSGTPLGVPKSITPSGMAHFGIGALAFICLAVSALLAGFALRGAIGWLARLSAFSGLAVLAGFFGGFFLPSPVVGIWFAVVVGWAWLTLTSWRLRPAAYPRCLSPTERNSSSVSAQNTTRNWIR